MPPEHHDIGASCSIPPDEIFTFSARTSSKSTVESTVVRPGLCVATGMKLRRRRKVWFGVATWINGTKQRIVRTKIRRLVLFSLCEQGARVDNGTNALIFETIPCEVCEGQSPCQKEWFRIIAKRPHLVRNSSRACRCLLCVAGLATFQYHLQFSGVSSTLVPCSHPWGEDVKERLTKCSHWSGPDKDLFQSHAMAALEGEMRMDWPRSAQEYRCCLGIVIRKVVEDGAGCRASQFWLMMWAAFALISLYYLRLRDFEKYFEISHVVSDVPKCHLRTSLSYFTKGRKTCKKRRLEVKGVLRKTLADLQGDCNRVQFEHGLTKKATKSGNTEVELCGQLCEQHARAGNYEEFLQCRSGANQLCYDVSVTFNRHLTWIDVMTRRAGHK